MPAKYICSFEEFVEKRIDLGSLHIKKKNGNLTEETIEAIWEKQIMREEKKNEQ